MVVETRCGRLWVVIKDAVISDYFIGECSQDAMSFYNEDLTNGFRELDIVKVYRIAAPSDIRKVLMGEKVTLEAIYDRNKEIEDLKAKREDLKLQIKEIETQLERMVG